MPIGNAFRLLIEGPGIIVQTWSVLIKGHWGTGKVESTSGSWPSTLLLLRQTCRKGTSIFAGLLLTSYKLSNYWHEGSTLQPECPRPDIGDQACSVFSSPTPRTAPHRRDPGHRRRRHPRDRARHRQTARGQTGPAPRFAHPRPRRPRSPARPRRPPRAVQGLAAGEDSERVGDYNLL